MSSFAVTPPGSARDEARLLLKLAGPVIVGSLGLMLMGTIDVLVVGRLGGTALAALSLGNTWSVCFWLPAAGVLGALDPVVAQAHGAGDQRAAGLALARGLLIVALLSIPVIATQHVSEIALAWMGQPPEVLAETAAWCEASSWGLPFSLAFWALRAWLQARGLMRPATVAILIANVVNLAAALPLVYGLGGWAGLGVAGAGYATSFARLASVALLAWITRHELAAALRPLRWEELRSGRELMALLGIGVPLGAQLASEVWAFNAISFMMGWLGTATLAANGVVLNLASISFMLPMSLSTATSVRVGNLLGAGLHWARSAWTGVALGAGVMVFSATLFLLVPRPLILLFTQDPEVVAQAVMILPFAAAFQLFDGTQVSCYGALRGAGDVRMPSVANLVGYWLVGVPLGWWLAFRAGMEARGLWTGLAVALGCVAGLLMLRLASTARRGGFRVGAAP